MIRALKNGRVLGFLIDQDTSVPSAFVPFFNRLAATPTGAAVFANRCAAEVVVGVVHRGVDGRHYVDIEPFPMVDDVVEATASLTRRLEMHIRRHPSQWVWIHRRWKTRPTGDDPEELKSR